MTCKTLNIRLLFSDACVPRHRSYLLTTLPSMSYRTRSVPPILKTNSTAQPRDAPHAECHNCHIKYEVKPSMKKGGFRGWEVQKQLFMTMIVFVKSLIMKTFSL